MKQLIIIIFLSLLSTQSFAGVGDLYNCEETSAVTSLNDGYISNQNTTLSNFSFLRGVAPKEVKTRDIYRGALPFVGLQVAVLALIIAVPGLVDWLPRLAAAMTPIPLT